MIRKSDFDTGRVVQSTCSDVVLQNVEHIIGWLESVDSAALANGIREKARVEPKIGTDVQNRLTGENDFGKNPEVFVVRELYRTEFSEVVKFQELLLKWSRQAPDDVFDDRDSGVNYGGNSGSQKGK